LLSRKLRGGGCLALAVLLGPVFLPGEVQAAKTKPVLPLLVHARVLLNSARGPHISKASGEVQNAIKALGGPTINQRIPPLPGGFHVLLNRILVLEAKKLLKQARTQLSKKPGTGAKTALTDVNKAIQDIDSFLVIPWIF
jgi:hypothetical protein